MFVTFSKMGGPAVPLPTSAGALTPVGHDQVELDATGWVGEWQVRNLAATIPHVLERIEKGEARSNLARLVGESDEPLRGMPFTDSDVYKALEAVAWASSGLAADDPILLRAQQLVELLDRVRDEDGYLNSRVQGDPDISRWSAPQWGHELYCAGHLIQAAVAAARTGALPDLVPIATRFADLLGTRFGPAGEPYLEGHPEVETALVELYRLTGTRAYLDLAAHQLAQRGHGLLGEITFGAAYFQDHAPVRAATEATGHAVRQLYLLAGAVDVAVETGDDELLKAVERLWEDLFATKTYVTGAHGSRHRDEAIGDAYELPPDRAYAETCAAIASFQLNWRLLLATGNARYAEAMETGLYNAIAVSTSATGTEFFYSNPLQLRTGHDGGTEDSPTQRRPWFTCACCPPNIARLLASIHDYLITTTSDGVQIHHPAAGRARITVAGGDVVITTRTAYPHDGLVRIDVETEHDAQWELALRVPAWCESWELRLDGDVVELEAPDGYLRMHRPWSGTHEITLQLDMPVRTVTAHPRVDAVRGCVALARGPVLYAIEQADVPDTVLEDLRIVAPLGARPASDPTVGPVVIDVRVVTERLLPDTLYAGPRTRIGADVQSTVVAIPYHRWANRTPGAMRVWLPIAAAVDPTPGEQT